MPIDFNSPAYNSSKTTKGSVYPLFCTDTADNFDRIEELVTPDILRADWLFSVPLYDKVNKRPITDIDLKRVINRAISQLELDLKINIFPAQRDIKIPFDSSLFRSFGATEIPYKPVNTLLNMYIEDADNNNTFTFPSQIIDCSNLAVGFLSFGPVTIATPNGAVLNSAASGSGGTLVLTQFINLSWIPQFFVLQVITGFPENKVPTVINELIGITSALEIFSRVAPLFKVNSQSLGHDSLSQSVSGPGTNVFARRIEELQAKRKQMLDQVKHHFYSSIIVSNV